MSADRRTDENFSLAGTESKSGRRKNGNRRRGRCLADLGKPEGIIVAIVFAIVAALAITVGIVTGAWAWGGNP